MAEQAEASMAAFAAEVGAKVEAVAAQGREESAAVRCGAL